MRFSKLLGFILMVIVTISFTSCFKKKCIECTWDYMGDKGTDRECFDDNAEMREELEEMEEECKEIREDGGKCNCKSV
jgi:hypothetical protein